MKALRLLLILVIGGGLGLLAVPLLPRQAQEWVATRQSDVSSLADKAWATLEPTATPRPGPTATSMATPTTTPEPAPTGTLKPTPTATRPPVVLKEQLPRDVYQQFHNSFYVDTCSEPPVEHLGIARQWSGEGSERIDLAQPSGTYFFVVQVVPDSTEWHLNSTYRVANTRWDSLRLSSEVPDKLLDAQEWCGTWSVFQPVVQQDIDAAGVEWTLSLIAAGGPDPITDHIREALGGYYGVCPAEPPEESLRVVECWSSDEFGTTADIDYTTLVPFTFLVLDFEPNAQEWRFDSVNRSGGWAMQGPAASSQVGRTIDITALCPSSPGLHALEVRSSGGEWTVWLVGVPAEP